MNNRTAHLYDSPTAKTLLRNAGKIARQENYWLTGIGIVQTLSTIVFAATIALLINNAVYLQQSIWQQTHWWWLLTLVLSIKALLPLVQSRLADKASAKIRNALRTATFQHCQHHHIHLYPSFSAAELSSLISTEIDSTRDYFAEFLPQQRLAVLAPLLIIIACSSINWLVPLIFALTAPLVPLFMIIAGHKAAEASQRNLTQLNRLGNLLADRIKGINALQLARTTVHETESVYAQSENYRRSTMQVLRLAFLSGTLLEFFSAISVALVAVYLGLLFLGKYQIGTWSGEISLGHGIFLLMLAPEFYLPLRRLGTLYHARADAISVAEHLLRLFSNNPSNDSTSARYPTTENQHKRLPVKINAITFRDLQTARHGQLLNKPLNLTLTPGQSLLLRGSSGIGKSTLLDTLAGFLPIAAGQLLINQQTIDVFNHTAWQSRIGYIAQQPELLFDSIRHNLCLGRAFTDEQLFAALAAAQADALVKELPKQLDYHISDSGGYLSGGQAQRIALARIFLHQPDLLLLDEPTANLDNDTAGLLLKALQQFTQQGGMLIMASHRTSDTAFFQQIVTLHSKEEATNA
ncbi:thiol reductant ABC exporter subunit CydD [Neptunomonas japonica]|uniref:Cysteine/glutathione ABC transporter permease/ATP-binding protein n=1 Tax=Neptunomonas japonica JAMM 1380 TaxID=1441457 RepID=A0A7R6PKD1_9GAMM|nr:thiol reductant ABC exporter subunit CydD [Neptunomonas japonica]BBB28062.1 cysteine/glutathione ABC transporter permease/ATP-binding protein [Neptunomonas japonica JAMM 1380]